jgi:hypothetical protein
VQDEREALGGLHVLQRHQQHETAPVGVQGFLFRVGSVGDSDAINGVGAMLSRPPRPGISPRPPRLSHEPGLLVAFSASLN